VVDNNTGGNLMLKAEDLTKTYEDGRLALDHLNLEVLPGEIFCLLGANGAGKTTTINLFFGFIEPTDGTALINGINVSKEPLKSKKQAAYVSEDVMLYPNLSAMQNLEFFARLGSQTTPSKDQCQDILKKVGLSEDVITNKVKTFSKGMRQKLGIAIALIKDSPAVLLDEPTSGVDPKAADEFLQLLVELKNKEKALFMSTHDIFRAKKIADNIGIMRSGRLVAKMNREDIEKADLEKVYVNYMESD
jgi:ABC-2 type transport system ATP-binding protein